MIEITSTIKQAVKKLKSLPGQMNQAGLKSAHEASVAIVRAMRRAGAAVTYPIHWDSIKQKIAVILKLMREGNLPYQRTNAYINAWLFRKFAFGYQVENIGHKAVFMAGTPSGSGIGGKVTATGQSHIHEGRWPLIRVVLDSVVARLPQSILRAMRITSSG